MKDSWVKEKAYRARRAVVLTDAMEEAIASKGRDAFMRAYMTSMNYMTAQERTPLYKRFLSEVVRHERLMRDSAKEE